MQWTREGIWSNQKYYILSYTLIYLIKMSERKTYRFSPATIERLRAYKPSPSTTDEWCLTWVLDKLTEADEEINRLHDEIEKLRKETKS